MLLKMRVSMSGGFHAVAGDEMDFGDDEALRLVDAGYAVPTKESKAAFDKLRADRTAAAAEAEAAAQAEREAAAAAAAEAEREAAEAAAAAEAEKEAAAMTAPVETAEKAPAPETR